MKRHLPTILAIASLPAGLLGYALGVFLMRTFLPGASDGVLIVFVPLFVAGLCMVPFLIPFLDRKAKADLAAYRASQAADADRTAAAADAPSKGRRSG